MSGSRIGITGHSRLTDLTHELVAAALRGLLADARPLVGVTCLAQGSDQLFADVVLELGGDLEVILPSNDYREAKVDPADRSDFDRLLGCARVVRVLDLPHADRAAYRAANEAMIATIDRLLAVWDGAVDEQPGSTADTVSLAKRSGVPMTPVWPDGAQRA
jgi:hypothetical protein